MEKDLLEKFQGRFEAAKAEILNLCSKYNKFQIIPLTRMIWNLLYDVDTQTNSDTTIVRENLSDDGDDDISEEETWTFWVQSCF